MGDDCNATARRSEDSRPPSSSTPRVPLKDLEESRIGEIPMEERGERALAASRPESGEPSEGLHKISDDKHDEAVASEPPLSVPPREHFSIVSAVFPFSETKLRPDAPPFTPESLSRSGPADARRQLGAIDRSVSGEPMNFELRAKNDNSRFVNVDLRSPAEQEKALPLDSSNLKRQILTDARTSGPIVGIRNSRDPVKDPGRKPFGPTFAPSLERSPPKIGLSVDSLQADLETNGTVAVVLATETGANDLDIGETGLESGEPRVARVHWRFLRTLRTAFVIGNRIRIVVFIASIVLCVVIIIYVFV